MAKIDFWALAERVRLELGDEIEYLAMHPRLCEEDGERLMARLLTEGVRYITPACGEKKQQKLLRDGFRLAGVPMDEAHWTPVSMAHEDTAAVFAKVRAAVDGRHGPQGPEA
jgi:hypothetical protein